MDSHVLQMVEIQKKFNALHDNENVDSMTYDDFLKDVIEMTEEEYIKVIRSTLNGPKVFLKRTPSEVRVNPYMKIVLSAWKALCTCFYRVCKIISNMSYLLLQI
jgi:hypothetical protein